jgi:hypothetical protein
MGIFFDIRFFIFASNYIGFEGCWWFQMPFPCYKSWLLMEIIFSITTRRVYGSNESGDFHLFGKDYSQEWQINEVNPLCRFLSFSCLPKSRESKVIYVKNAGCFIRNIFFHYLFYWFFCWFF